MGRQHGDDLHDESNRSCYITSQQAKFAAQYDRRWGWSEQTAGFWPEGWGRRSSGTGRRTLLSQASVPTICRAWQQIDLGPGRMTYEPRQSLVTGATSAHTHTSNLHSAAAAMQQCSSRPLRPPCTPSVPSWHGCGSVFTGQSTQLTSSQTTPRSASFT